MAFKILKTTVRPRSHRLSPREYFAASRIYVFTEGETIFENLMNRRSRPFSEYRKLIKEAGILEDDVEIRWSQKAGCSCGCSPGFIVDRSVCAADSNTFVDFHVTVCDEADFEKLSAPAEPEVDESYLRLVA